MYDSEFICTYKQMDTPEEQEQLYKIQLLQAFKIDNWDDDKVNTTLYDLYTLMNTDTHLETILQKVAKVEALQLLINMTQESIDMENDNETYRELDKKLLLFSLLFKFEYFDLFHRCIYDFIHDWTIKDNSLNNMLNNL
uniref:Uncharacterized protein n=1 Tax=viral metagenome TaxID=1070528 RepID=A0A6C0IJL3_9ZZZZ